MRRQGMSKIFSQGIWRTIGMVAVLVLTSAFVFGQAELGTIAGVVKDSTGAVVADAKIVATETSTNATRTAASNNLGEYHIQNLPPGVGPAHMTRVRIELCS
jgi:hypothetical protein